MDDLKATLDGIGWSAGTLARMLGCHRTLPQAWLSGRAQVPAMIKAWLVDLAWFHSRHLPPPDWRTRSATSDAAPVPQPSKPEQPALVERDEEPDPAFMSARTRLHRVLSEPTMNGVGGLGGFHLDGRTRFLDGSYIDRHGNRVGDNPWQRIIHPNGRHSFRSARPPDPDVYVETDGHIMELRGRVVDPDGYLRRRYAG